MRDYILLFIGMDLKVIYLDEYFEDYFNPSQEEKEIFKLETSHEVVGASLKDGLEVLLIDNDHWVVPRPSPVRRIKEM